MKHELEEEKVSLNRFRYVMAEEELISIVFVFDIIIIMKNNCQNSSLFLQYIVNFLIIDILL